MDGWVDVGGRLEEGWGGCCLLGALVGGWERAVCVCVRERGEGACLGRRGFRWVVEVGILLGAMSEGTGLIRTGRLSFALRPSALMFPFHRTQDAPRTWSE